MVGNSITIKYFLEKVPGNQWLLPLNPGERFYTATFEYCSYLGTENHHLFYSTDGDVTWMKAKYLFDEMNKGIVQTEDQHR